MRLAVSGGGTGGHIYPILAIVAVLQAPPFSLAKENISYLGTRGHLEEGLAQQAGLAFETLSAGAVRGRAPGELIRSLFLTLQGTAQAWRALRRFCPGAVLATGGYVSVPAVMAAWLRGIPVLLYLPDVEPGLAVRFLSFFATKIAVTVPPATAHLPRGKTAVTGYPVRPTFGQVARATARAKLGLRPDLKTLLIWGGSQGATAFNQTVTEHLRELLQLGQIVHVCGAADYPWVAEHYASLSEAQRSRCHLSAYLHEGAPEAMAAADLAVSRAGASVLGEFPMSGLPAVLVPYPHAGAHQRHNASYLARAGAAVVLPESQLSELVPLVRELFHDEARLKHMAARAKALAEPDAAAKIAALLVSIAKSPDTIAQPQKTLQGR